MGNRTRMKKYKAHEVKMLVTIPTKGENYNKFRYHWVR
jgi:hypothetical protein